MNGSIRGLRRAVARVPEPGLLPELAACNTLAYKPSAAAAQCSPSYGIAALGYCSLRHRSSRINAIAALARPAFLV